MAETATYPPIFETREIDGAQYVTAEECARYALRCLDAAALAKSPAPDEREAFEKWVIENVQDFELDKDPSGNYWNDPIDTAWQAWQSRALQDRPVQPSVDIGCPACADTAEHEWAIVSPERNIFYGKSLLQVVLKAKGKSEVEFMDELANKILREPMRPTYYVRHPDDSYSVAEPQP